MSKLNFILTKSYIYTLLHTYTPIYLYIYSQSYEKFFTFWSGCLVKLTPIYDDAVVCTMRTRWRRRHAHSHRRGAKLNLRSVVWPWRRRMNVVCFCVCVCEQTGAYQIKNGNWETTKILLNKKKKTRTTCIDYIWKGF